MLNNAFIAFGSNIGNKVENIKQAIELLKNSKVQIDIISKGYVTEPWGYENQPTFLNVVAGIYTPFDAIKLLEICLAVETQMGRVRTQKWGPRTIDIDILTFNEDIIQTSALTIPHPHIKDRFFVLAPWTEIASNYIIVGQSKTIAQLKDDLEKISKPNITTITLFE